MGEQITTGEVARALVRLVRREASDFANAVPPYRMAVLAGQTPESLLLEPKRLFSGDKAAGAAILAGRFTLAGDTLQIAPGDSIWARPAPSRRFAASLHGFDWLRDVSSVEDPEAGLMARTITDDWVEQFGQWNWFAWSPAVTARRLDAWLSASALLFENDEPP